MQEPIRLQKFLSQQGVCSRREAEELIRAQNVLVNGKKATLGDRYQEGDLVLVKGKAINTQKPEQKVIAFYKPRGVECTLRTFENHKTLASFDFGPERLFPIGRLDKESEGLVLMTNDGELANRLMHPRYEHEKEYEVTVDKTISQIFLKACQQGIKLEEGTTQPAKINPLKEKTFRIILKEGKKRQIRRMCQAFGLEVIKLQRIRIQDIHLEKLKPGEMRVVSDHVRTL